MGEVSDLEVFEATLRALAQRALADESLAIELYGALCNMRWRNETSAAVVSMSWRHAGGVVSGLTGHDCYLDYYCSGNEGQVSERVRAALGDLGWTPAPWPD
jgi:hypothetical protein